ncbi:MAG: S9 family peptidase [Phycisphaerales bacterium]|nr:S9 family peptidase [Phycisphaerales bacterium]
MSPFLIRNIAGSIALATASLSVGVMARADERPSYPETRVAPVTDTLHGDEIIDPYRWLENRDDPAVIQWIDAENALTDRYLGRFKELRESLANRLVDLYGGTDTSAPTRIGQRYFFTRRTGDQNHAIVYYRDGGPENEAKVAINPNTFSDDGATALDWWYPSPNGRLIAYGRSDSGSELSTLYLRLLETDCDSSLKIPRTRASSIAWDADSEGFYYIRYPEKGSVPDGDENYYRRVYHHRFGTDPSEDPLVFGDGRAKEEWADVATSSDYLHTFISASLDWTKNDLFMKADGSDQFVPIAEGLDGTFEADVVGDALYLMTNYKAPRYRVLKAPLATPGQANWVEIIPEQAGVIRSMVIVDDKIVIHLMENAFSRLMVYEFDGKLVTEIPLPSLGSVGAVRGKPDGSEVYFEFESYLTPPSVYQYNMATHELKLVEQMKVDVDTDQFETKQVWFNSKDGTRVPMFVIARKGVELNGQNPTVLYGYGGFDISLTPKFDPSLFIWLERGGVYAVANLRGGGEFGKDWHTAGRLDKKQNVFDDMIAAAEKLVADRYTNPDKLGIRGGSNGGLLMGAMITQRPDLFAACHCAVPLLDMLRYHQFSIARLWIPEYGSAEDADQYAWLKAYSPYQHVRKGVKYPATLFTTGESDSRVDPMHAMKMTALLQADSGSDRPILLKVERKAGHGQGKPLRMKIDSQLDYWIFFMWRLGLSEGDTGPA